MTHAAGGGRGAVREVCDLLLQRARHRLSEPACVTLAPPSWRGGARCLAQRAGRRPRRRARAEPPDGCATTAATT
ncbi:MAG: hypothetical protein MZW92_04010 [Comamonadaceae bacterium]|nr:hypothetical protein [Comamonadaceae bacterium]